ncbi:MAG: LPS export ABC transporter periplasmic protein LptC [Bryobacteraceae bacterium]
MRRISLFTGIAAVLLSALVGYTYKLHIEQQKRAPAQPPASIKAGYEAKAPSGWFELKSDPRTNKPIVQVKAKSFEATVDPSTFELHGLALRLYNKSGASYTYVESSKALYDERSGMLRSQGPVHIVMNVPADQDAENPKEAAKLVRVTTSGIVYNTKTGKASTDQPASFVFPQGDGQAVGAGYDPNQQQLHLKSQVSLDWIGNGPVARKMHVETADLVYNEAQQKVYLSPWSKLQRQTMTIQAGNSVVTLKDGVLQQIDADHAAGTENRDGRQTNYSAAQMTARFDSDGNLVEIVGTGNARVVATEKGSRTTITGDRADLRFQIESEQQPDGKTRENSALHEVLADGHAVAESVPLPQPGAQLAETRILRSDHIQLEMKPGGQEVQEIRSPTEARVEFKPNRPGQAHRILNASHLEIVYGAGSYVAGFRAWKVATRTEKPGGAEPALTWSDEMLAKFQPNTNQIATIRQSGHFRYRDGTRKASADQAFLQQAINRMTLTGNARVSDDNGSTLADAIVMNQGNGDMDASGHVVSTHNPNPRQKPGTSMLDSAKTMQASAERMQTRDKNTKVQYDGDAVIWQGANRIAASTIDIDRSARTLHATGRVVSQLVDNKPEKAGDPPIFTVVRAPDLLYRDDTRVALYTGGVKLTRGKMTIDAKQVKAFLTPNNGENNGNSSLDHAFADGDVRVTQTLASGRTRTGTSNHCEYYTKNGKVVLKGGLPQLADSYKGITKGRQLTYYSDSDQLLVDGVKKQLAFTRMEKK